MDMHGIVARKWLNQDTRPGAKTSLYVLLLCKYAGPGNQKSVQDYRKFLVSLEESECLFFFLISENKENAFLLHCGV